MELHIASQKKYPKTSRRKKWSKVIENLVPSVPGDWKFWLYFLSKIFDNTPKFSITWHTFDNLIKTFDYFFLITLTFDHFIFKDLVYIPTLAPYNHLKKMCSATSSADSPAWNVFFHTFYNNSVIFRRPLHSKGCLYISRCLFVCPVIGLDLDKWIFFQNPLYFVY